MCINYKKEYVKSNMQLVTCITKLIYMDCLRDIRGLHIYYIE